MAEALPRDRSTIAMKTDKKRELQDAIIEDAAVDDGEDRDLVHGEGGTLGLPTKPEDISHDD
jgi:hypothetical protein